MTFDFFNTSYLAFGKKLTAVFKSLLQLSNDSEKNISQIYNTLRIYNQYLDRNYKVPFPTKPTMAARTNEIYNILNSKPYTFKQITFNEEVFKVELIYYNSDTNRITNAYGSTDIKEGECRITESLSNQSPVTTLNFYEKDNNISRKKGKLLFEYRVDDAGNINLKGDNSNLNIIPFDFTQYKSLSMGDRINFPFTAEDNCCVCCVGYDSNFQVKLNNRVITQGYGAANKRHCIVYLKKGDIVSGAIHWGFKINYNTRK